MKKPIKACLILIALSNTLVAKAADILVEDGGAASAEISINEATRVAVKGRRIAEVFGVSGKADVVADSAAGHIYVKPSPLYAGQPFSMFIKDDQNKVYTLQLTPVRKSGGSLVLIERHADVPSGITAPVVEDADIWEKANNYESTIVQLIKSLVSGTIPEGYGVANINRVVPLWQETEVTFLARYQGAALAAEHYVLRNVDNKVMRLAESEFYRPGVLAVAIEDHELPPGASTHVYLVRIGQPAVGNR